jgi:CRP/FNR family cyclic AMP-dependent transcriptional regulator
LIAGPCVESERLVRTAGWLESYSMATTNGIDPKAFLASVGEGRSLLKRQVGQTIFSQWDPADALFFLQRGKVKVTTVSQQGKEAVVAILGAADFFGEGCLAGQPLRISTVAALADCSIARLDKLAVIKVLQEQPAFSAMFMTYLLARNIRMEADLIDQLFNSSEKRLARLLLLLANFGKEGAPQPVLGKISQETLAEMVGTTRSRVSYFMNKFRRLGFIEYNGHLEVHSSLLSVVLHDDPRSVRTTEVSKIEQSAGEGL